MKYNLKKESVCLHKTAVTPVSTKCTKTDYTNLKKQERKVLESKADKNWMDKLKSKENRE